jgi:hypothetical protein
MLRTKTAVLALGLLPLTTATTFGASGPPPFVTGQPTPVIVQNPASNPAPVAVTNDPGRSAYQSTRSVVVPFNFCGDTDTHVCFLQFPAVPAGHRLVVQNISGEFVFNAAPKSIKVTLTHGGAGFTNGIAAFLAPSAIDGSSLFSQPTLLYISEGEIPVVSIFVNGATIDQTTQTVTLSGYMLDCSAISCAPVAQ